MVLFGCGPGKTQFPIVNRGSLPHDPLTHEFNDHRFDQRRMHVRRSCARLVPAGPAAGASFARYLQGHGEGGCRYDRYALRSGFGFTGGLGQEFVRRDEYCDRAKRRENHPAGPKDLREQFRGTVAAGIEMFWPEEKNAGSGMAGFERAAPMEEIQAKLRGLAPATDAQRQLLSQAEQITNDMLQARWLLIEQAQSALPMPFLVVLLFWLTMLHLSFALFAPRNATVFAVLLISALSMSGAIFIILEMNHPLQGMIKVSSAPMRKAMEHLGQ
jgi:hypothetical protein